MRRKDREISDYDEMLQIADACDVCRIALQDDGAPYIVPLNFGWEDDHGTLILYFHGADTGRKLDLIELNDGLAGFETDCAHRLSEADTACDFSYYYSSIIGEGRIEILEEYDEKVHGLRQILRHYVKDNDVDAFPMKEEIIAQTCVLRMRVTKWSAKSH